MKPRVTVGEVIDVLTAAVAPTFPGVPVEKVRRIVERERGDIQARLEGLVAPRRSVAYYATYSGTRRNLAAMEAEGIRILVGPDQLGKLRGYPHLRYAIDNGAWAAFRAGAGGLASLELSLRWLPYVAQYGHPLLAVQDGMEEHHVEEHVGPKCGIFVGGSTSWKWATLPRWAEMARIYRCYIHVGRVNGARRLRMLGDYAVDSADGTAPSRYSVNAPRLAAACRCDNAGR
jgi:hypothetical protein